MSSAEGAVPQLAGARTTSEQPVLVLSIVILRAALTRARAHRPEIPGR